MKAHIEHIEPPETGAPKWMIRTGKRAWKLLCWFWIWLVGSVICAGIFWIGTILKVNFLGPLTFELDPPMICTRFIKAEIEEFKIGKGKP